MHNARVERFFDPRTINGGMVCADAPIKNLPARGIRDSPCLHDKTLLNMENTGEFFKFALELRLTEQRKNDRWAFLRQL
jgi:hypothetical protein